MEVPIFENEAPVGTLRIYTQGLYTVLEARLPAGEAVGADSIRPPMKARADLSGRLIAAPTVDGGILSSVSISIGTSKRKNREDRALCNPCFHHSI